MNVPMRGSKRTFLFHIGWPKSGSTTLQSNVFPQLRSVRYLGKTPLSGKQNGPFFSLVNMLSYATDDNFFRNQKALLEMFTSVEKNLFGDNDDRIALLISDEGILGTLFKPVDHQHHGASVADMAVISKRLRQLEESWNADFQFLIVERDPIEFLHSYYAQLFFHFKRFEHMNTFSKYVDSGISGGIMTDLGFSNLKKGSVIRELLNHFNEEKIHSIPLQGLFGGERVFLKKWYPLFDDITNNIRRENVRTVNNEAKLAKRRGSALLPLAKHVASSLLAFVPAAFRSDMEGSRRGKEIILTNEIRQKLVSYLSQ